MQRALVVQSFKQWHQFSFIWANLLLSRSVTGCIWIRGTFTHHAVSWNGVCLRIHIRVLLLFSHGSRLFERPDSGYWVLIIILVRSSFVNFISWLDGLCDDFVSVWLMHLNWVTVLVKGQIFEDLKISSFSFHRIIIGCCVVKVRRFDDTCNAVLFGNIILFSHHIWYELLHLAANLQSTFQLLIFLCQSLSCAD